MSSDTNLGSINQKIGEIAGMLRPIPDQLSTLFDKVDAEKEHRSAADSKISSDLRSTSEEVARLGKSVAEICRGMEDMRCVENKRRLDQISALLDTLSATVKDLTRLLDFLDGRSKLLDDLKAEIHGLREKIKATDDGIAPLLRQEKRAWAVLKCLGDRILTVGVTLLIAYLLYRFGWK